MMGAFICGAGYYTSLWGQFKDEENMQRKDSNNVKSSLSDEKVPLLQEGDSQV